jgi:hypothetical protein
VIVEASIASLNDAVITASPVAPLIGFVEFTVGAVVSDEGPLGLLEDELHPAIPIRAPIRKKSARKPCDRFKRP